MRVKQQLRASLKGIDDLAVASEENFIVYAGHVHVTPQIFLRKIHRQSPQEFFPSDWFGHGYL